MGAPVDRGGLRLTAVGENPEAADTAGISVARTRWTALVVGGALMALGGSFLTLSVLGTFTLDIVSGRGWICIALVIFGRWKVWPVVLGALLFGFFDALQLQLAITSAFGSIPTSCSSRCPTSWSSPPWRSAAAGCATGLVPDPLPPGLTPTSPGDPS